MNQGGNKPENKNNIISRANTVGPSAPAPATTSASAPAPQQYSINAEEPVDKSGGPPNQAQAQRDDPENPRPPLQNNNNQRRNPQQNTTGIRDESPTNLDATQPIRTDQDLLQPNQILSDGPAGKSGNPHPIGGEIELPERRGTESRREDTMLVPQRFLTPNMEILKRAIMEDKPALLHKLASEKKLVDPEEALVALYVSVVALNNEHDFNQILEQNDYFRLKPTWHVLFTQPSIFRQLTSLPYMAERCKFDELVLGITLERDITFITDILLQQGVITPQTISLLISDNQQSILLQLLRRPIRPKFLPSTHLKAASSREPIDGQGAFGKKMERIRQKMDSQSIRVLHFADIVESMIDLKMKSSDVISIIKLMQNEVNRHGDKNQNAAANFGQPPNNDNNGRGEAPDEDADGGNGPSWTINDELNYNNLFAIFVKRRKIKLLRYLFSLDSKTFTFTPALFLKALQMDAFDMAALLHKEFFRVLRDMESSEQEQILSAVIGSFSKNNGGVDYKCYLFRNLLNKMLIRHARQFLEQLRTKIRQQSKQNILVMNLNVVKSSCLLIEALADVGLRFNQLQVRCHTLRHDIIMLCRDYMNQVENEAEMKHLLLQKDFEYRDSLDLISKFNILEFLESQYAENVVNEIWRSPYATQDSILAASTNHALTFKYWNCVRDEEYETPFCRLKDVSQIEAHLMQFTVWRFSPKARTLIEFLVTVILAFQVTAMIDTFIITIPKVREFEENLFILEDRLAAIDDKSGAAYLDLERKTLAYQYYFEPLRLEFFRQMQYLSYLSFVLLFFAFQHIPEIIYTQITKRQFNPYIFKNLLDFLIWILFFTFIIISYGYHLNGSWKEKPTIGDQTRSDIYTRNFFTHDSTLFQFLLMACEISLWLRFFYLLKYHQSFGRILNIVAKTLPTIANFILFFLIEVFFFTMLANQAFVELEKFNTFESAYVRLVMSGFGFFRYRDFMQPTVFGETFGQLFLFVFLIFNLGLFLSLFTSVLSVLYSEFQKNESVFSMLERLRVRPFLQADKEYSALISLPPPLNALLFFLAPFLMTSKNPEIWNKAILWVAYLPILVITFVLFFFWSIFLIPLTFVKMFFHKMIMIFVYSKSYRVSRADKFMLWVLFAIIGLFRLTANALTDLVTFLRHAVRTDLRKTKVSIREKPLSKDSLYLLKNYFNERNERLIPFKQAAGEIRDNMNVFQLIATLLRPVPYINFNKAASVQDEDAADLTRFAKFDQIFQKVREYETVKQILEGNSEKVIYEKIKVKAIDCKILDVLFEDVLRQRTVAKIEDDNYVFIRRAMDAKTRANMQKRASEKAKLGPDVAAYVEEPPSALDFEEKHKADKRQRKAVRSLIHCRTQRMLQIIGYKMTEKDARRMEYAVNTFGDPQIILRRGTTLLNNDGISGQMQQRGSMGLKNFFGQEGGQALEDKIAVLGSGIPKLDSDLLHMQHEMQTLVENYLTLQKKQSVTQSKASFYQDKLQSYMGELDKVRKTSENEEIKLTQFVEEDYFYGKDAQKDGTKGRQKSKVSFADQTKKHSDAGRAAFMQGKNRDSFVSNPKLLKSEVSVDGTVTMNSPSNGQPQGTNQSQQKEKVISLRYLKKFSVEHQRSMHKGGGQYAGIVANPGEDSDVPYISDNTDYAGDRSSFTRPNNRI